MDNKRSMTALVTAIGSFSAEAVITTLKEEGIRVVGCDIYPAEWIVSSMDVDSFYRVPKSCNESEYLQALKEICVKEHISCILPLTDPEIDVLTKFRDKFEKSKIGLLISADSTIQCCRNKLLFYDFCSAIACGFKTIPTDQASNKCPYSFPVICKPVNGRSSQGVQRLSTQQEWDLFISELKPGFIVQPYIEGENVTVDVVRHPLTNKTVALPRTELLRTSNGAGLSVHVFHDEELSDTCCELAQHLNITGCVNFEFIHDKDGEFHLLECNPRFSGGVSFSHEAGYDMVLNHLRCFSETEDIDSLPQFQPKYMARRYEQWVTAIG